MSGYTSGKEVDAQIPLNAILAGFAENRACSKGQESAGSGDIFCHFPHPGAFQAGSRWPLAAARYNVSTAISLP